MFGESKCRGESDLGLRTTSGLAKRMRLRSADLRQSLWPNTFFNGRSALRSRIFLASPEVVHRPRSQFPLYFDSRRCIIQGRKDAEDVLYLGVIFCRRATQLVALLRKERYL